MAGLTTDAIWGIQEPAATALRWIMPLLVCTGLYLVRMVGRRRSKWSASLLLGEGVLMLAVAVVVLVNLPIEEIVFPRRVYPWISAGLFVLAAVCAGLVVRGKSAEVGPVGPKG